MRPTLQAIVDRLENPYAPCRAGRMYVYDENSLEVWTSDGAPVGIRELHDGEPYEWGNVDGAESVYLVVGNRHTDISGVWWFAYRK